MNVLLHKLKGVHFIFDRCISVVLVLGLEATSTEAVALGDGRSVIINADAITGQVVVGDAVAGEVVADSK